jgi:hypothetical protein
MTHEEEERLRVILIQARNGEHITEARAEEIL